MEFEAALTQLNSWMECVEAALSVRSTREQGALYGISVEQQLQTYKDIENDVKNHKMEVDRVVALGKHLIEEAQRGKLLCFLYLFVEFYLWSLSVILSEVQILWKKADTFSLK